MKNIALILAGGVGARTHQDIPKQFIHVKDIPVIIYTLKAFQNHPWIDSIEVVCLEDWHKVLWAYAKQFEISKLENIVNSGETVQESIRNGVFALREVCGPEDTVVIHHSVRPVVEEFVLTNVLEKCREHGNAVTSLPFNEQVFMSGNGASTTSYIPRDTVRRVLTPQAYHYGKLLWAYEKAFSEGVGLQKSSFANTLMVDLGETLYFAAGSEKNIKITTSEDIEIFRALLESKRPDWLK